MASNSPGRFVLAGLLVGINAGESYAQSAKPAPAKPAPAKPAPATPAKPTPAKPEPAKPEPAKPEPAKPEPAKPEPAKPAGGGATDSAALAEARSLFIEGNAHYGAGRYALAAERFIKAYELSGRPALLFNLANTYERAGDYQKAAHYLRMYLDGGEVHDQAAVRARLQRLEQTVVELERRLDEAGAPASSPAPASEPVVPADEPATPTVARGPSRVPYYAAAGGVAAGATAAIVFGLLARSERSELDALCVEQDGGLLCDPAADAHLSSERRYALLSDIGIGVTAASVATGVIYYLVTRDGGPAREPDRQGLSFVPSASGDGLGVVAVGRF